MKKIKGFFLNETIVLYLIIANTLIIFFQEFKFENSALDYVEPLFTLLFIIELLIKINVYGYSKYISNNWNRFDFVLILISIPSLSLVFNNSELWNLNIFLALRVLRVFKFVRLIRFFPNVGSLISSIKRALRASYIVFIGFFLMVFIVSLIRCAIYKNTAPEFFNNPINSFYSIFRLFSVEGWYEIPNLIASRSTITIAFLSKLYFATLLLCGGIIGLSLVNSIFVDAMVSDNNDDLQEEVAQLSNQIKILSQKIDDLNNNSKK